MVEPEQSGQKERPPSTSLNEHEDVSDTTKMDQKNITDYSTVVPDGGWGWFVVFGGLLTHIITGGVERSAGVFYLIFYDKYGKSAAYTSWVTIIPSALRFILGPLCSALSERFSCRAVVIGGTFFFALTMIISGFATSLEYLLVSFSVVGGVGRCFVYPPAVMMVAMYFNKKRAIAAGISSSGVGIGALAFPPLIEILFDHYGFQGAFLVIAGLMMNLCVCGALFRPLSFHRKLMAFDDRRKNNTDRSRYELEEERAKFINHDKSDSAPDSCSEQDNIKEISVHYKRSNDEIHAQNEDSNIRKEDNDRKMNNNRNSRKKSFWPRKFSFWKKPKDKKNKDKNEKKKKHLNLSVLADIRFLTFCIAILMFTVAFRSAFTFLPAYGRQIGASDINSAVLLVTSGVADGFGRILSGIVMDLDRVKKHRVLIYNSVMYLIGALSFTIPSITSYAVLSVVSAVYGLLVGIYISQKSVILVDLLGQEKIISTFGILIFFQGVGMLIGPPLSGFLKDINGTYDYAFYVGGIAMFIGAIILTFGIAYHTIISRRKSATETSS